MSPSPSRSAARNMSSSAASCCVHMAAELREARGVDVRAPAHLGDARLSDCALELISTDHPIFVFIDLKEYLVQVCSVIGGLLGSIRNRSPGTNSRDSWRRAAPPDSCSSMHGCRTSSAASEPAQARGREHSGGGAGGSDSLVLGRDRLSLQRVGQSSNSVSAQAHSPLPPPRRVGTGAAGLLYSGPSTPRAPSS